VKGKVLWHKPGLELPDSLDTAIFDVDGVIWEGQVSCNLSTIDSVGFVLREIYHLESARPVTFEEIAAFKKAGGFNDDWNLSWALTVTRLAAAKGRWGGALPPPSELAEESGGRGIEWAKELLPESEHPPFPLLRELFDEFYWGDRFEQVFGRPPIYVRRSEGHITHEKPLVPPEFFDRLEEIGVDRFGIATGRHEHEMYPLEELGLDGRVPQDAIVTADIVTKPNPEVLRRITSALGGRAGVFVGDTRDDLELVLRWKSTPEGQEYPLWAVIVAPRKEEQNFYSRAGADIILDGTIGLPEAIMKFKRSGR